MVSFSNGKCGNTDIAIGQTIFSFSFLCVILVIVQHRMIFHMTWQRSWQRAPGNKGPGKEKHINNQKGEWDKTHQSFYWLQHIGALVLHKTWIQTLGNLAVSWWTHPQPTCWGNQDWQASSKMKHKLLHGDIATWEWKHCHPWAGVGTSLWELNAQDAGQAPPKWIQLKE